MVSAGHARLAILVLRVRAWPLDLNGRLIHHRMTRRNWTLRNSFERIKLLVYLFTSSSQLLGSEADMASVAAFFGRWVDAAKVKTSPTRRPGQLCVRWMAAEGLESSSCTCTNVFLTTKSKGSSMMRIPLLSYLLWWPWRFGRDKLPRMRSSDHGHLHPPKWQAHRTFGWQGPYLQLLRGATLKSNFSKWCEGISSLPPKKIGFISRWSAIAFYRISLLRVWGWGEKKPGGKFGAPNYMSTHLNILRYNFHPCLLHFFGAASCIFEFRVEATH